MHAQGRASWAPGSLVVPSGHYVGLELGVSADGRGRVYCPQVQAAMSLPRVRGFCLPGEV